MQPSHRLTAVFDDPNRMSAAGLVPVLRLAEAAGLTALVGGHLTVPSANAAAKTGCVIGGMLAGADSIDRLRLLRHGAMSKVFTGLRAPSTLGMYLRAFTHGHVQQLDAVGARLLAGLAARAPGLLAGAQEPEGIAFDRCRRHHPGGPRLRQARSGVRVLRGPRAQRPARGGLHTDRGAGDRPGPTPGG